MLIVNAKILYVFSIDLMLIYSTEYIQYQQKIYSLKLNIQGFFSWAFGFLIY